MKILITGGCGFVGSGMALDFKERYPNARITAFDNLKRRGSELNLAKLKEHQIEFVHGDIRSKDDLFELNQTFDLFIEASAEPSVLAGLNGSPDYLLQTNLVGTLNCLEFARKFAPQMIFLSTSRVYSIGPLREIQLSETETRFEIAQEQTLPGVSNKGINEDFTTSQPRSLYGATKLASELILQEYVDTYGMKAVVNRCGVIAGPGQFGKVDQGVFTMWVANHYFDKPLKYIGFGGTGKQVRDLLHPSDLFEAVDAQWNKIDQLSCEVFNLGGGVESSTSLYELTSTCQEVTGNDIAIGSDSTTTAVDIPLYVSDNLKAKRQFDWTPKKNVKNIVDDIYRWLKEQESITKQIFG